MSKIIIFGTGDIAQIAEYYFRIDTNHEVVAFTVHKKYISNNLFDGLPVIPFEDIEKNYPPSKFDMFIAMSYSNMNKNRELVYNTAKQKGYKLQSYISSKCTYLSQYNCGDNCFIFEDNTIQPFVKIGNNVTLWSGNHVGHHSTIEDHIFISSHVVISGHCLIKSNTFIGVNSTIHNGITIEKDCLIAAGAIISKNTIPQGVYVPAQSTLLSKKSNELIF